ncbi:MAG: hypothetical protein AB7I30_21290, partial [Isosphaeraceae bacterium]
VGPQRRFLGELAKAPAGESFAVPRELSRLIVSHAYLGQLDVSPLGGRAVGGQTDRESIELRAEPVPGGPASGRTLRITGASEVAGRQAELGSRTDGRQWNHSVRLDWEGYVQIADDHITRLVMTARGTERLRWGTERWNLGDEPDVAHLMAGHPIDLDGPVLYGLSAEPCVEEEIAPPGTAPRVAGPPRDGDPAGSLPRRLAHLREAVKHLRAAGAHDVADHVERQIQRIDRGANPDGPD